MKRIICVDEKEYCELNKQGIDYEPLFTVESEWECNNKYLNNLKGAVLVSAFVQGEKLRLFFRTPDNEMVRLKVPLGYYGGIEIDEL